ncbi:hypothetical protein NQZ68_021775 [Dissostichus eleginoides]|nr:hypothetical protein NQZ68_021775 [Dissostichus eleginoides]
MALFPGASGVFNSYDLTPRGHYEVHGEDDVPPTASSNMGQRFSFMRTPATRGGLAIGNSFEFPGLIFSPSPPLPATGSACSPAQRASAPPRATVSKTFQRSVYLADLVGGRLSPSRMVVVRFLECEASIQGIIGKSCVFVGAPSGE